MGGNASPTLTHLYLSHPLPRIPFGNRNAAHVVRTSCRGIEHASNSEAYKLNHARLGEPVCAATEPRPQRMGSPVPARDRAARRTGKYTTTKMQEHVLNVFVMLKQVQTHLTHTCIFASWSWWSCPATLTLDSQESPRKRTLTLAQLQRLTRCSIIYTSKLWGSVDREFEKSSLEFETGLTGGRRALPCAPQPLGRYRPQPLGLQAMASCPSEPSPCAACVHASTRTRTPAHTRAEVTKRREALSRGLDPLLPVHC